MSKNDKKVCRLLNYIDQLLILISAITRCVSISSFASLVGFSIRITSSTIRLKICAITAEIRKYKSIIQKKKKKHDKIVYLAKSKLNSIEVLTSKVLIDTNISYDGFVLINNVLKKFCDMNEEIENPDTKSKFILHLKQCYLIV